MTTMTMVDAHIEALTDCQMRLGVFWQRQPAADARLAAQRDELLKRLSQCAYFLQRVKELDHEPGEGWESVSASGLAPEIETMTEAFYYFAFRLLCLCKSVGLGDGRKHVRSINLARNKLIEHSDEPGGVMGRSFGWGAAGGPEMKPLSSGGDRPAQPGLYHHASDLVEFFRTGVTRIGA